MKKALGFVALFVVMVVGVVGYLLAVGSHLSYSFTPVQVTQEMLDSGSVEVRFENPEVVRFDGYEVSPRHHLKLNFSSIQPGTTSAVIKFNNEEFPTSIEADFMVGSFRQIVAHFSNIESLTFHGWPAVVLGVAAYAAVACVLLFLMLRRRYRTSDGLYSYKTILLCAAFLLALAIALELFAGFGLLARDFEGNTFGSSVALLTQISSLNAMASTPIVAVFGILLSISNLSLIRHEGARIANLLGIVLSVGLLVLVGGFWGLFWGGYSLGYVLSIYSALLIFFEAMLAATIFCAIYAVKHRPDFDKDYILILGCGIKKDGTLMPLLRGRVDRAIRFYKEQLDATGKKAVFVPSGGQGSDEIISESEAMKRYLLSQGIEEAQILKEDRSTSTLENMKFSKALIEQQTKEAKVIFSTTNYHVYRSGMYAVQAGLKAEGIGSRTKWYFWPNAFIRELVGLLVRYRKAALLVFVVVGLLAVGNVLLYNYLIQTLLSI